MRILSLLLALLSAAGSALADDERVVFAISPSIVSPLPMELAMPETFHEEAVGLDGRLRLRFVDLSIGARGWPLTLARRYAPGTPDSGFGPDWAWSFEVTVDRDPNTGTLFFTEDEGGRSAYAVSGPGRYRTVAGRLGTMVSPTEDGGLLRTYADGSREIYDPLLRLQRREGEGGYGYNIIRDGAGRPVRILLDDGQSVTIAWEDARVRSVRDDQGRAVGFGYTGGRLTRSTDLLRRETTFAYDSSGTLAELVLADRSVVGISHDLNARVSQISGPGRFWSDFDHWGAHEDGRFVQTRVDAEGQRIRKEITRDPVMSDHYSVVEIGPDGVRTVVDHRDGEADVSVNEQWVGGVIFDSVGDPRILLDDRGATPLPAGRAAAGVYAHPDELGHPRLIDNGSDRYWVKHDAVGRVVAMAGPSGRVEEFEYDAGDRLVRHRDAAGTVTEYAYDAADRPVAWRNSDGRWQETGYTEEGLVAEVRALGAATYSFTYDRAGRLVSLSDGLGAFEAIYDDGGFLDTVTNDSGRGIRFHRNVAGQITRIEDDLALDVSVAPDSEAALSDAVGRLRGVVVDANGGKALVGPGGAVSYVEELGDQGTLVTTVLPDGQGLVERYEASGALIAAEALSDDPYVIETDDLGRVVLAGDPLMPSVVTYDDAGLVSEVTDAIGIATTYEHDAAGRLRKVASPYLGVEYIYDGDNPVPRGIRTSEGDVLTEDISPDGLEIHYTATDRTGRTREEHVTLDAFGRVAVHTLGGSRREFSYPDTDTVVVTEVMAGRELTWHEVHDAEARTTTLTRPDGGQEVTTFDPAGRPLSIRTPEGHTDYELDAEGAVLEMTRDGHRTDMGSGRHVWAVVGEEYREDGGDGVIRVQTIKDPRGNTWRAGYGSDGRALWSEDPLGGITRVERNAIGQITRTTDPAGRSHYAVYDDLGRATETGVLEGWSTAFGWEGRDPAGQTASGGSRFWVQPNEAWNAFEAMVDGEPNARYVYDEAGRLTVARNGAGETRHLYRENGDLTAIVDPFGRRLELEYDNIGRLAVLRLPDGDEISYAYEGGATLSQTGPDGVVTTTSYNVEHARFELVGSDGTKASLNLSPGHVIGKVAVSGADGSRQSLSVDRAADSSVSAVTKGEARQEVERDALGRVTAVDGNGVREVWGYDGSSNVTSAPDGLDREFNSAWQMVRLGETRLDYDLDGRLVRHGDVQYRYDPFGRISEVRENGSLTRFDYDAFGQLIRRTRGTEVEEYLWFQGELLAVYGGDGKRIALIERNPRLRSQARIHSGDGATFVMPDQIGTPSLAVTDGQAVLLPTFGTWGEVPEDAAPFMRWVGYAGAMTDTDLGFVHTKARLYFPGLQMFGAPDPLGIDNPVNPYSYASLDPLSLTDRDGHASHVFNPTGSLSNNNLNPRLGPQGPWRDLHNQTVADLENALRNETRPHIRRSLNNTLQSLRNNNLNIEVRPTSSGYGSYHRGTVHVNPTTATARDPRFRGAPPGVHSPRAVGGVIGHEGRHYSQALTEARNRTTIGRLMKEFDAHLEGTNVERAVGGFHPRGSERRLMHDAMDYAFRTEYRSYLQQGNPSSIRNTFAGSHHPTYNGLRQMSPDQVARIARLHMPEIPRHQVLDEWVRTAEQWRANPAAEAALRSQGPGAVQARNAMIQQAREAASRARTAALAPHRPLPQLPQSPGARSSAANQTSARPTIEPPRAAGSNRPTIQPARSTTPNRPTIEPPRATTTNRPTIEPPRATTPNRPTIEPPRSGTPPQPGRRITQRLPVSDFPDGGRTQTPGARTTQRHPASELPDGGSRAATGPRPSGGARNATRPTVTRPANAGRPPTTRPAVSPTRPRPPATQSPPPHNPRPSANPNRPPARATGAPDRPPVRLRHPATIPDGPRAMPNRPRVPDTARPSPSASRPSARGGRYRIPDLQGGGRVTPPPRASTGAGSGRPPLPPRGARITVPEGPNLGRWVGRGLGLAGVVTDVLNTHRYITGEIGHADYWTGMALSGAGYVLPYPLNAAIAAHSVGSALGGYSAYRLLEDARNGDRAAQALLNFLLRSGFINANDPTFVATAEATPPLLRGSGRIVMAGEPQWLAFAVWSETDAVAELTMEGGGLDSPMNLGPVTLVPGSNPQLLAPEIAAILDPGDYRLTARAGGMAIGPVLALRVVEAETPESIPAPVVEEIRAEVSVTETRLRPTDLPWERFDRPEALLSGPPATGATFGGSWEWLDDPDAPTNEVHLGGKTAPAVHYVLFDKGTRTLTGDNIIQYLFLDAEDPPEQVVLQVYDGDLSGAHRVSLGADLLPFEERGAFGFVSAGNLPSVGQWMRLRIPVSEIGMDGRDVSGLAFYVAEGATRFGPTRLSGPEDTSPRLTPAAGRDTSGAPEAEIAAQVDIPSAGQLELSLTLENGSDIRLFEGAVSKGARHYWSQGEAGLFQGARLTGTFVPTSGDPVLIDVPVTGNPALVARVLYPPAGAVVRQTVPIFGQAGGGGFSEYVVDMRRLGGGESEWIELARSPLPTVMTDHQIRTRIDRILEKQLRSTVHGNLASLQTGSALHRFEFGRNGGDRERVGRVTAQEFRRRGQLCRGRYHRPHR